MFPVFVFYGLHFFYLLVCLCVQCYVRDKEVVAVRLSLPHQFYADGALLSLMPLAQLCMVPSVCLSGG